MNTRSLCCCVVLIALAFAARAADVVNNVSIASSGQMPSSLGLLAQAFDTGAEATRLDTITVRLQAVSGTCRASVQLWTSASASGVPETLVDTLSDTGDFTDTSDQLYAVFSLTKPPLAANTRYWVVLNSTGAGTFNWRNSNSATFTTALGATLPSVRASQSGGGSWTPFGSGDRQIVKVAAVRLRVTTNAASGAGSLAQVLQDAFNTPGPDTITFDPALSGQTITPNAAFNIGQDVTIDATGLAVAPTLSGGGVRQIVNANGTIVMKGLTFSGGASNGGGAIYNNLGRTLTLERCTFAGNTSSGPGGAIWTNGNNLTLRDCTFFNNTGTTGGAIYSNGNQTLTLTNCTFSGNTGTGGGGAIFCQKPISLNQCTVVGNGSGTADGGGIYNASGQTLNLTNCIVAGNTTTGAGPDIANAGAVGLNGVNFIGELSGSGQSASATLLTGEAGLAKLGDYGGPTQTMPPLAGSPAIDAAVGSSEAADQRGASRTSGHGSAPDLGAVELAQIVVNTAADENDGIGTGGISLREAIAINTPLQAELIRFDPAVFTGATPTTNTISLGVTPATTSGIVVSNRVASVDARDIPAGVTIDDGTATTYRLFEVSSGSTLAFAGITLANGGGAGFTGAGGAILVSNGGTVALTRCTLSGNQAGAGGAIANASAATLAHCTLSGNQATTSGGAISNASLLTLTHCTLTDNHVTGPGSFGGAILLNGTVSISHCLIAGNTSSSGPDIYNNAGTITPTGVNFIGDPANSGLSASATILTTAQNGDVKLDPTGLAARGGPTKTIALLDGSPALNAASGSTAATDQRGISLFGLADLGAYERQLGTIGNGLLDEDTAGTVNFTVGSVGTLSASSNAPALVGLALGGSGAARTLTLTPAPDANGAATITVTDSLSGETQTFALTVQPVNDAPVFTKGADQNVFVDATAQTATGWATGISAGPADESGQMLSFAVSNTNNALFATQPAVAANGTLTFTPAAGVRGVATVTVTLSDDGSTLAPSVNTSAAQTFRIGVRLLNPQSTKVLAAGGTTPDAAPGRLTSADLPDDAVLASFGLPATSDAGDVAFIAKWSGTAGGKVAKGTGLFLNNACLAVVGGDASAIGGAGARWKSFSDPVVEGGKLACLAKLSTGATAVVCNLTGAALEKIALTGEQAAEVGDAKFKKFSAVALRGGNIGFLATLTGGTGANKITAANDAGVWFRAPGDTLHLIYRDSFNLVKIIGSFVTFAPGDGSAGSGRGWFSYNLGPLALTLNTFTDKTRGIIFGGYGGETHVAHSGEIGTNRAPALAGAGFETFRLPAMNDALEVAFYATMKAGAGGVVKADAGGIFAAACDFSGPLAPSALVARLDENAGATGGKFSAMKDPVLAQDGALAFPATIKGTTIKGAAAKTLWWRPGGGALTLLAQGGGLNGAPTDLPTGAQWKSFGSLAIAADRGPIFTASLVPKFGGATTANASGVWAMDFGGTLRTLFRTGDSIGGKTLKTFTLLKATVGNTGVTRSFNDAAQVVWLATFTDKTQAIVTTEVP